MEEKDKIELERLLALTTASPQDKNSAMFLYTKYINNGKRFCMSCAAQVQLLFKQLKNYYKENYD